MSIKRTVSHKSIATVAILMTLVVGEFICVLGMSFGLALVRRISVAVLLTASFFLSFCARKQFTSYEREC